MMKILSYTQVCTKKQDVLSLLGAYMHANNL